DLVSYRRAATVARLIGSCKGLGGRLRSAFRQVVRSLAVFAFPLIAQSAPTASGQKEPPPEHSAAHSTPFLVEFRNAAPGVAYVGSKACQECHGDINQSFMKTDMSRAMSLPSKLKELP